MTVRLPAALLFVCALLTLGAAEPGQTLADPPLVSLELSHSPATVTLGQDLTLTDKVNAGAHTLSNVVLTDTLPHEFTFVRGDAPGGACTVDTSGFFPIITCTRAVWSQISMK